MIPYNFFMRDPGSNLLLCVRITKTLFIGWFGTHLLLRSCQIGTIIILPPSSHNFRVLPLQKHTWFTSRFYSRALGMQQVNGEEGLGVGQAGGDRWTILINWFRVVATPVERPSQLRNLITLPSELPRWCLLKSISFEKTTDELGVLFSAYLSTSFNRYRQSWRIKHVLPALWDQLIVKGSYATKLSSTL